MILSFLPYTLYVYQLNSSVENIEISKETQYVYNNVVLNNKNMFLATYNINMLLK